MNNNHLIIGLGGTGGKVIRQIVKTIERDKSRSAEALAQPRFDFLYVDTSDEEVKNKQSWMVLGKSCELHPGQIRINKASSARPLLEDPATYPNIKDWIEPLKAFDRIQADEQGAGQRRKIGRLVFAQNATYFASAVDARIKSFEGIEGGTRSATIHVVCGLSGGTGSGSVVDAVATIRAAYPSSADYPIFVYAVLPESNAPASRAKPLGASSPYYANAYAAIAELNAMAVGAYNPFDVRASGNGARLDHAVSFNQCYLVHNVNENRIPFEIDRQVPGIIAEFIYQKTLNTAWTGLSRAEKSENDARTFELGNKGDKERSKLFMSLGIKRVVVPDEEITEYLAYGFAEEAAKQLMFNNFRPGEGYADEPVQKDWLFEGKKEEVGEKFLLTPAHLTLEVGILVDDAKSTWKPHDAFWQAVVDPLVNQIKSNQALKETDWVGELNKRLADVFDSTYRRAGGVREFYKAKGNARVEMARHVRRHVEKLHFEDWRTGKLSLLELRHFTDALISMLGERQSAMTAETAVIPKSMQDITHQVESLTSEFNKVGLLKQRFTDKRPALFADIARQRQRFFSLWTRQEGLKFACTLVPMIREHLVELRGAIDGLQQTLAKASETAHKEHGSRLGDSDSTHLKRVFDKSSVDAVLKAIVRDENGQRDRTFQIRKAIIELAGSEVDSFEKLGRQASVGSVLATLSQQSARLVEDAHQELAKTMPAVMKVNIIERLQKKYEGNEAECRSFVETIFKDAGVMITLDASEIGKSIHGVAARMEESVGVFLPACDSQKKFRQSLSENFKLQASTYSAAPEIVVGKVATEIVILKVASLIPARFIAGLADLKKHYDGLLGFSDPFEKFLLHSEGEGGKLPPLYAMSSKEIAALDEQKPYLLLAYLLGMLKQRQNKTSGLMEWRLQYMVDDLPETTLIDGKTWEQVLGGSHPAKLHALVKRHVDAKLGAEYKHVDRKLELVKAAKQEASKRFEAADQDDTDEGFVELKAMVRPISKILELAD